MALCSSSTFMDSWNGLGRSSPIHSYQQASTRARGHGVVSLPCSSSLPLKQVPAAELGMDSGRELQTFASSGAAAALELEVLSTCRWAAAQPSC